MQISGTEDFTGIRARDGSMGQFNCLRREENESGEKTTHAEQRHDPGGGGWKNNHVCHAVWKTETRVYEGEETKTAHRQVLCFHHRGLSDPCRAYLRGDPMREVGGVGLLPALCRRRTACRRNVLRSRRKMTVSSLPGAVVMRHISG